MTCPRCRKSISQSAKRCPYCGESNPGSTGTFQTSTVLISADGNDLVYRSVEEVPSALRTRLLKSTNGTNSATILIADRKGRKELARRAIRKPQGAVQKRLGTALVGAPLSRPQDWLNAYRRELLLAALLLVILFATWLFLHHGPLGM
jgi:hypothetical protein